MNYKKFKKKLKENRCNGCCYFVKVIPKYFQYTKIKSNLYLCCYNPIKARIIPKRYKGVCTKKKDNELKENMI